MDEPIEIALAPICVVRQGVILFDTRHPGPRRDFQIAFLECMIFANLGGIGIIQNANDPIHNLTLERLSLSVLPCVTLHPGMDALFPELS